MTKEIEKNSVMDKVDWLSSHNKNYTKEQYHTILELQEQIGHIIDAIESTIDLTDEQKWTRRHFLDKILEAMRGV